jgi:hypothetical protein
MHSIMVGESLIGHFPSQMGTGLFGGGTRLFGAPSDHWSCLTWLIAVGYPHTGLSGGGN